MNNRIPVLDQLEDQFAALIETQQHGAPTARQTAAEPALGTAPRRGAQRVRMPGAARRRRRRAWVASGALVAGAVATVFGMSLGASQSAIATLTRNMEGDAEVFEFSSIAGSTDEVNEQLRAAGYTFEVEFVPGPPSAVGDVSGWGSWSAGPDDPFVEPDLTGEYLASDEVSGDRYILRIEGDTSRTSGVQMVRRAHPGEMYVVSDEANAAGNPLACTELTGPIDQVLPKIEASGLEYEYRLNDAARGETDVFYPGAAEVEGTYVESTAMVRNDLVLLFVAHTPISESDHDARNQYLLDSGCSEITP